MPGKRVVVECPWPNCDALLEAFPCAGPTEPRHAALIRTNPPAAGRRVGALSTLDCPHGTLIVDHEGGWIKLHSERLLGRRDPSVIAAELASGART